MIAAPEFAPYPLAEAPVYSRWLTGGIAALALGSGITALPGLAVEPVIKAAALAVTVLLWTMALLLRVLYQRLNHHNAQAYDEAADEVLHTWWARHRQKVAWVDSVLVGAACPSADHRETFFSPERLQPVPLGGDDGPVLRIAHVFGQDTVHRERQLAAMLALQWLEQQATPLALQPVHCYWQGSQAAWQSFVEQMKKHCPQSSFPETPQPWQGHATLNAIIDRLQGAPADARILCAGCHCSPASATNNAAAGEAALLWLFGPNGGVKLSRGEWFTPDAEVFSTVAQRVLKQCEQQSPPPMCLAFCPADQPGLAAVELGDQNRPLELDFGALGDLQPMVAQTIAAWYAEQYGKPCAWLANDLHHPLALGIVEPDDSIK